MFSLRNTTRERLPRLPFEEMADYVLGQGYEVSLVFVTSEESHKINLTYRKLDKPTNILSFPLSKEDGEIIMDIRLIKEEAKTEKKDLTNYIAYLFIHGLTHLKGFEHGDRMEVEEKRARKHFSYPSF